MKIKNILSKSNKATKHIPSDAEVQNIANSDLFPIVKIPEIDMQKYRKIPLTGIAALGAAFSQLPPGARTIVQTQTKRIAPGEKLYVQVNPKGVSGFLRQYEYGTSGNIINYNSQGKKVIVGRAYYKEIDSVPIKETTQTKLPLDPTLAVIAVAVMAIEQKLDKIQASVEEVLRFLELEKQSKQRGNLRKLAEIADDYKNHCNDEVFCAGRNQIVQNIQVNSLGDIEFYQEKIAIKLQEQKTIHMTKDANSFLSSVLQEFAEYQLSCYIYYYCGFLDVMLRRDFSSNNIEQSVNKIIAVGKKYDELLAECQSQISHYYKSAVESKIMGGIGVAIAGMGKAIGTIPIIKKGSVDETLINAGKNLTDKNDNVIMKRLESVKAFENNQINSFIDSLNSVDSMYNGEKSLLTDGENLYVLKNG